MQMVFVGQQPATYEDEGSPLIIKPGSSGERLAKWMGVQNHEFTSNFARVNLNPWYDPDEFSPGYCKIAAKNLYPLLYMRRVILLGPAVAESFDLSRRQYDYFNFYDHPEENFLYAVIPHPSGRNRIYNDPAMVAKVRNFLQYCWQLRDQKEDSLSLS